MEDVRAVCAGMELDAVYFLHGETEDGEDEDDASDDPVGRDAHIAPLTDEEEAETDAEA